MNTLSSLILAFSCLASLNFPASSFAQGRHSILPGEPNPNTSPQFEKDVTAALIDDRSPCPKGSKKFQKLVCADEETIPKCPGKYHSLLECRSKPGKLNCRPPRKAVHVFVCDKEVSKE